MSDFEYRVWASYLLAADDFGVMRATAVTLQAADDSLAERPAVKVQAALDRLVEIGLVGTFTHQGRAYVYQHDWQGWQKVKYPRPTTNPCPSADLLAGCCPLTQALFSKHPGGVAPKMAESSSNIPAALEKLSENLSESFPPHVCAGAGAPAKRLTANGIRLTANGKRPGPVEVGSDDGPPPDGSSDSAGFVPLVQPIPRIATGPHRSHVFCWRACVPAFLHEEFIRSTASGPDLDAVDRELRAGYLEVANTFQMDQPTGEAVAFWRAWFRRRYGGVAKGAQAAAAIEAFMESAKRAIEAV